MLLQANLNQLLLVTDQRIRISMMHSLRKTRSSEIRHGNHSLRLRLHQIQHYRIHMDCQSSLSSSDAHLYLYQPAKFRSLKLQRGTNFNSHVDNRNHNQTTIEGRAMFEHMRVTCIIRL